MDSAYNRSAIDPYPGLASFADRPEARTLFFGREKEARALLDMILSENLVLLFARSGIGKTSLINAGVMEELRTKGFFPVVVRLTHDPNRGPISSVYECVTGEAQRAGVTMNGKAQEGSLWEYFYDSRFSLSGRLMKPILILDQFEELFTIIGPHKPWREAFTSELADLARRRLPESIQESAAAKLETLEADDPARKEIAALLYEGASPDVKIVLSIREDFLAELESLKGQIPMIFRNSFRLEPLGINEARAAIEMPTKQGDLLGDNTFTFAPGVIDKMLDFLRVQKVGGKYIRGNSVEPVQLQILCQHFYQQSVKKKNRQDRRQKSGTASSEKTVPQITLADLKGRNGMKRAMVGYYHQVLKQFPRFRFGWSNREYRPSLRNLLLVNRARAAIRFLCENKLVTPGGYRNSLSVDVIQRGTGVPEQDLRKLVDERLLRTEPRLGSHFYELTHDTLVRPLVKARRKRRAYWAALVALMMVIPVLFLLAAFLSLGNSVARTLKIRSLKQQVSDQSNSPERRIRAFKTLVTTPIYRDCSKCDLTSPPGSAPIDLHTFTAYGVGLSGAQMAGTNLSGATIPVSDFTGANLSGADLRSAMLYSSDFSYGNLVNAKLDNADLRNADLMNAVLTGARLVGAKLEGADFTGAKVEASAFQASDKTSTSETIWWTAIWPSRKMTELQKTIPIQSFINSDLFKKQIGNFDHLVEYYQDAPSLNSRAWYRAQCGVELDKAEMDARQARRADPKLDRAMDTLGFILLQTGHYDEAMSEFQQSLSAREQGASDPIRIGLAHYHLGLAFDRKGDKLQAQNHFSQAREKGYRPTYECLLTPPSDMTSCDWPNQRQSLR